MLCFVPSSRSPSQSNRQDVHITYERVGIAFENHIVRSLVPAAEIPLNKVLFRGFHIGEVDPAVFIPQFSRTHEGICAYSSVPITLGQDAFVGPQGQAHPSTRPLAEIWIAGIGVAQLDVKPSDA